MAFTELCNCEGAEDTSCNNIAIDESESDYDESDDDRDD